MYIALVYEAYVIFCFKVSSSNYKTVCVCVTHCQNIFAFRTITYFRLGLAKVSKFFNETYVSYRARKIKFISNCKRKPMYNFRNNFYRPFSMHFSLTLPYFRYRYFHPLIIQYWILCFSHWPSPDVDIFIDTIDFCNAAQTIRKK